MPKLLYQGHGSFRLTADDGRVIFVDPAFGDGYDKPADLILVTHAHRDHNRIELCTQNEGCIVITHKEAIVKGKHKRFNIDGIKIKAVEAGNYKHNPKECVGYIITLENVIIYASGDTSKTDAMFDLAALDIDYALFCGDGFYNMDLEEAALCAEIVDARHNIIIHTVPDAFALFDRTKAENWTAPNKLIIEPGQEIELEIDLTKVARENRRLRNRIKQLEKERLMNLRRIKVHYNMFNSPEKAKLRSDVMSLANEYAILEEETTASEAARSKAKEVTKESANAALFAACSSLAGEAVVAGEGIDGLETVWYRNADGTKTYLSMSPKLAMLLSRVNRNDYNDNLRHESYNDNLLTAQINDVSKNGIGDEEIAFASELGNPLVRLIREERARLFAIARQKREKELAEIKERLTAELPPIQAIYYYYSQYEKKLDTEIAAICRVSKKAVGNVLKKARKNAMERFLNKLQASPELEKWYEDECAEIRFYT